MKKKPSVLDIIAFVLLVIGGLNWGLVGVANFDLVASLLGMGSMAAKVVYCLVGLSAIYLIVRAIMCGKCCKQSCDTSGPQAGA